MFSSIRMAKKSIYLEMYIFQNDTKGFDFLAALEEKAREGVRVIVIFDAFGSSGLTSDEARSLRAAGAEVLFFSYWFCRLHRKILIIDEQTVFLGGVNISGQYAPWKDLQVRMSGKRFVASVVRSFGKMYCECKGKDWEIFQKYEKKLSLRKVGAWFLEHGVLGKFSELRRHYEESISSAKKSIVLFTPYFVPRRWLIAKLHGAMLRGVRVEIIIPEKTDHLRGVTYFYLAELAKLGAVCYLLPGMNHAKVMLVDGEKATVGSQNLDPLSFDWNAEAGVVLEGKKIIYDLEKILAGWKSESLLFTTDMYKPHRYDAFLSFLSRWM